MNQPMLIQLLRAVACALLLLVSLACGQSTPAAQSPATAPVLPRIEKYKAPPYPKSAYLQGETYDYRIKTGSPLPPTLTDILICDVWQRVTMDLKLTISPKEVSETVIKQALEVYLHRDWNDIAGYRPWTHSHFIRGLKDAQRDLLAKEIVAYINEKGVRDVDN